MKNVKIVTGANQGDESKGLVVNAFTEQMFAESDTPIIIFHNGTAQRGHTVDYQDGWRHVYHHFGSGSASGGRTYFADTFLIHPMEYRREYEELVKKNVMLGKTFCSPYCLVVTPFDMMVDRATEEWITITTGSPEHASCAMGSWCVNEGRIPRGRSLFNIYDFCTSDDEKYYSMLEKIWKDCVAILDERGVDLCRTSYKDYVKKAYRDAVAKRFAQDIAFFDFHNTFKSFNQLWKMYDNFIFEGGQGLGLDIDNGEWHTTSHTGLDNPIALLGDRKDFNAEVCYVTRAYETRHGIGKMSDEIHKDKINPNMIDHTNVFNEYQGNFRYGYLNEREMFARIQKDWSKVDKDSRYSKALVMTHCNEFPEGVIESKYYSDNRFGMRERR